MNTMRNSRHRAGRLLRWLSAAFLAGGLVLLGSPVPLAHADAGGANRYGGCLAAQKRGDLLLLFDESSSLQSTDAKAARVSAANYLIQTLGAYADQVGADLDVAVAGFADSYVLHESWTKLSAATTGSIADKLAPEATRNTGIDTDYWLALDGARQTLASRESGPGNADRCQAIAWFSDGKIDFTARPVVKPYAPDVSLDSAGGIGEMVRRATEGICRAGGVADQIRSRGIVMLAVGLSGNSAPGDFDTMSAIATGKGVLGTDCGSITTPVPGDFYPVSNLDDMLFAFDALNPDPGITRQGPVCHLRVCPEARHDFVLDRSIKSVNILGSGGVPGIEPYLISPSGKTLELPKKPGTTDVQIGGTPVQYEWQSDSAQTISIRNSGPEWAGRWAVVYVDTTGQHPDAVSKVNIHITTDIYPALANAGQIDWRSGQVVKRLTFGLADGQGHALAPTDLAGTARMSVALVPDGGAPIPLVESAPKSDIAKPVDANLTDVKPGRAELRMSLVVTTAPATGRNGEQIAPGTMLSPQNVEVPIQILPKANLPSPGSRIDFGTMEGVKGATALLPITGPGCAWISPSEVAKVRATPDGIGAPHFSSDASSPDNCLKVQVGQTVNLPVTLRTDHDGHGGLDGSIGVHVAALADPDGPQVIDVPFFASLTHPLSTTNFLVVLIAAILLGPGIPLALLYAAKWRVSRIPPKPLLAERIPVVVNDDVVQRDGAPFAMADTDLVHPVPGLARATRRLSVLGTTLIATTGRSPFGSGHVRVEADGRISTGSALPGTDRSGLHAVLPLAVHNNWVILHDPDGPAGEAEVLLLVGGRSDNAARQRIYDDVARRLPELLAALRLRAVEAGVAPPHDPTSHSSPFGETAAAATQADPFGADVTAMSPAIPRWRSDPDPFDPFDGGP
ncbi:hypothetical protein ABIA65_002835 [Mycolicibacterium sp. 624]